VILPKFFAWRRKQLRRSADQLSVFSSQIGIGTLLRGELNGKGNYHIQGEMVGDGDIQGAVVLAPGASWKGNVLADYVRIEGKVEGNVMARSKIDLAPTAVVTGNLSGPVVTIAEGARYDGAIGRSRETQVTRYNERRGAGTTTHPA
jgi:cytoskeletal protein CcmA (bactofilin family)